MRYITRQEFLQEYNKAPYSLTKIAQICTKIVDDSQLSGMAENFLEEMNNFLQLLDDIGFKFG